MKHIGPTWEFQPSCKLGTRVWPYSVQLVSSIFKSFPFKKNLTRVQAISPMHKLCACFFTYGGGNLTKKINLIFLVPMGTLDVDCYYNKGSDYHGTVSHTEDGNECQNWSTQKPHTHTWGSLGNHNFCRNPDGESRPWCYQASGSSRWGHCEIRECNYCDKGI